MSAPVSLNNAFAQEDNNPEKHEQNEQNEDTKDKEDDETEGVGDEQEKQVQESFEDLSERRRSFWIDVEGKIISFTNPDTKWRLSQEFTERCIREYCIPEASAMCVATQMEGPNPGLNAMVRIRKEVPWDDPKGIKSQQNIPLNEDMMKRLPRYASREYKTITSLTKNGCTCTPKLMNYLIERQSEEDAVPGGFVVYMLMEKLPGRNLRNFDKLSIDERDQVRIAFVKSLHELHDKRFCHDDGHPGNLLWDQKSKRVYIVDLEAVRPTKSPPTFTWYNLEGWGLAGVVDYCDYPIDPLSMEFDIWLSQNPKKLPKDDEWAELVIKSKGRLSLDFFTYDKMRRDAGRC
ncbi:hypothetical protein EMCG_06727 [[Emmonsia] crescens]|uniref:Uncharacterized protein n=1 Tax=[Emmonsia] crescens TaxID=73230 RepID=A0A0G2IAG0_9EURO|nr:hypothetical protein EMCG_06727 [Emmonsia crescens UAMH 3008]